MIVFLEIVFSVWAEIVGLLGELISHTSCKWSDPSIMIVLQGSPVFMQQLFQIVWKFGVFFSGSYNFVFLDTLNKREFSLDRHVTNK